MLYNDWTMTAGGQTAAGKAIELMRRQADGTWRFALDAPFGRA
jgi:ketosteroid isomerase-like protein